MSKGGRVFTRPPYYHPKHLPQREIEMQTFMPYPTPKRSARCLDFRRLGKQRVECKQIISAIEDPSYGWQNHPAVSMWRGHVGALKIYANAMITEWIRRGYVNNMPLYRTPRIISIPNWIGNRSFHRSHKSNLLRKDEGYYKQFTWKIPSTLEYVWPMCDCPQCKKTETL
jgi:hypothetical protein